MKILHIIPSYIPARYASGPINAIHSLNKALAKQGAEVMVYTTNIDGRKILEVPLDKEIEIDGVKIRYFPITFRPWQYSWKMHRVLSETTKDFDVIHITSIFLAASTLGAYYAKKFEKPYVISPHGSLMEAPLKRHSLRKKIYLFIIERINLAGAVIHFVSEKEKEDYVRAGLPSRRLVVVPNVIDPQRFELKDKKLDFRKRFSLKKNKKIIFYLGRLHPIKGFDTLIPAFAAVISQKSDAVLIIAGDDQRRHKDKILKFITKYQLRLGENVIFVGWLGSSEKRAAFEASDVFVYPSYTEASPIAVMEAMYFGLPIVITENSGLANDVKKTQAGFVIKKDIDELTKAINYILDNPKIAAEMGERGRLLVRSKFSPSAAAAAFIKVYNELIQ